MSLGEQILTELGRRQWRYGRLTYEQHQELKLIESHAALNAFLATHDFPIVDAGACAPVIADALIVEMKKRDEKEVKAAMLTSLLSAPEGLILLVVLSPLLLIAYIVRSVVRLTTNRTE